MTPKTLYFDESGYSGYNLLDPAVPFFTIASTDIQPDESAEILRAAFPRYQGNEFKFQNIWSSNSHRTRLAAFCEALVARPRQVHTWTIDKRFAVLTKIVEFLVEPIVSAAGYDFYANGYAQKFANYLHVGLTLIGSEDLFDSIIRDYQGFSRNPSKETLASLQWSLELKANSLDDELSQLLGMLVDGAHAFLEFHDLDTFRKTNELHLTSMLSAVVDWRKLHKEDFEVVHDASSTFFRQRGIWEKITANDVPEFDHPLGDGTSVLFPLRVVSTTSVDSKDSSSVQLCDLVSGIINKFFMKQLSDEGLAASVQSMLDGMVMNGIFPGTDFPEGEPSKAKGPDVIDQMLAIMNRNR